MDRSVPPETWRREVVAENPVSQERPGDVRESAQSEARSTAQRWTRQAADSATRSVA